MCTRVVFHVVASHSGYNTATPRCRTNKSTVEWEGQTTAVHWTLNSRDCDCWLGLVLCVWLTSQYPDGSRGFLITRLSESGKYTQRADADSHSWKSPAVMSRVIANWAGGSLHIPQYLWLLLWSKSMTTIFIQLFYFRMIFQTWWNSVGSNATRITMIMATRPRTAEYASILISRPNFESDNDKIFVVPYGGENNTTHLNEMIRV